MELIKPGTNIDFVGKRKIAYGLSIFMIAGTLLLLLWRGGGSIMAWILPVGQ